MGTGMTEAKPNPLGPQAMHGTGVCSKSVPPGLLQSLASSSRPLPGSSWGIFVCFCPHFGLYLFQAALWNLAQKTKREVLLKALKHLL